MVAEEASLLTPEMLKQGTWKNKKFRAYNIALNPPRQSIGRKHPYKEFLDFVKYKFIGMGFEEMRGPLVENEFWDMDALFMPQFHPARNIHDVYFVKEPASCKKIEEPFGKAGRRSAQGRRQDRFDRLALSLRPRARETADPPEPGHGRVGAHPCVRAEGPGKIFFHRALLPL